MSQNDHIGYHREECGRIPKFMMEDKKELNLTQRLNMLINLTKVLYLFRYKKGCYSIF
jgi:hypothetical protein